jgi:PAS domain S-box-containing protein
MGPDNDTTTAVGRIRQVAHRFRYAWAALAALLALLLWFVSPLMHRDPFAIFLLAAVACARFLGFGPAVLCGAMSVGFIDYYVYEPQHSFVVHPVDLARMFVFMGISLLAASLARQRTQAELRADDTMRQLAAIVESSDDAIYSTHLDGTIISWNRGAQDLYGYSPEEVLGKPITLVIPSERLHDVDNTLEHLQKGERVPTYRTDRLRKNGARVSVLLSVSPLRDKRGSVIGASSIARDITAQQRAEEALRRSEKLAEAGRLTAVIAHEINNPLEAVTNLLYLARQDPSRADQHLQMAEREVQRIADIVEQTLGFVRDASPAAPLHVSATVSEVVERFEPRLNAKHIQTRIELAEEDEIFGFAGELRQMFSNLIANAIDALDEGGCLRLRVVRTREWSSAQPGVRITIADSGMGIRPEYVPRVFEPFFTTKHATGTGLGLWLCEGIARKHGGSIRLRTSTQPGRTGTAFAIFLPKIVPAAS